VGVQQYPEGGGQPVGRLPDCGHVRATLGGLLEEVTGLPLGPEERWRVELEWHERVEREWYEVCYPQAMSEGRTTPPRTKDN
jgi:hypothetical protein